MAGLLSASALAVFAFRLTRFESTDPRRVIAELHLAQLSALLLAAIGAVPIGLAVGQENVRAATLDITIGVAFVALAAFVQRREPRDALLMAAAGFVVHALVDIAHRPGWLAPELAPRWYVIGCAVYDVSLAAICFWPRRR